MIKLEKVSINYALLLEAARDNGTAIRNNLQHLT